MTVMAEIGTSREIGTTEETMTEEDIVKEIATIAEEDMEVRIGSFNSVGCYGLLWNILDLVDKIGMDSGR